MKPIFLQMQAFGAFAQKTEIDFESLSRNGLFLVYGPTGSGKTTIFDAISVALFGETTSGRKFEDMRSQYCSPDAPVCVELIFSSGSKFYYIKREVSKLKKSLLYAIKSPYEKTPLDTPLSKEREIDSKIKSILSFSVEQFKQIVVLPQGKFSEFLKANSNDKSPILRQLFGIEIFAQIFEKLKEKNKKDAETILKLEYEQKAILQPQNCESDIELEKLLVLNQSQIQEVEKKIKELEQVVQNAYLQWQSAIKLKDCFEELEKKNLLLNDEKSKHEEIAAIEKKLKEAQNAEKVIPELDSMLKTQTVLSETKAKLVSTMDMLDKERHSFKQKNDDYNRNKPDFEEKLNKFDIRLAELKASKDLLKNIEEKKNRLFSNQKNCLELKKESQKLSVEIEEQQKFLLELKLKIEKNSLEAQKIEVLQLKLNKTKLQEEELLRLRKKNQDIQDLNSVFEKQRIEAQQKLLAYQDAQSQFESIEQKWIASQAALLALDLEEGKPCPVCGSVEHPEKALTMSDFVDNEKRNQYKNLLTKAEELYLSAKNSVEITKNQIFELQNQYLELKNIAKEIPEDIAQLAQSLKKEFDLAQKAQKELESLKPKEQKLQTDLESKSKTLDEKDKRLIALLAQIEEQSQQLETERKQMPKGIESLEQLVQSIAKGEQVIKDLRNQQEKVQKELSEIEMACVKLETTQKTLEEQVNTLEIELDEKRSRLEILKNKHGFVSENHIREAHLSQTQIQDFEQKVAGYHRLKASLESDIEKLRTQIGQNSKPDVAPLQTAYQNLKDTQIQAYQHQATLKAQIESQLTALEKLRLLETELTKIRPLFQELKKLEDCASGKNRLAINLEGFVLGALLDEVLVYTNQRLHRMSSSRYQIFRIKPQEKQGNARQGLDLAVYDAYTAQSRSVNQLSGGETFFTSLALALGLSDVASARQGGVKIEALFIDEGFGTLDAQTLDLAMDTLTDLELGNKLVGIISHVSELKERVPVHLEVVKTRMGSKIRTTH
jgi:exonuclease SbcC